MISGQCSNKNCPHKIVKTGSVAPKKAAVKKSAETKGTKTRRTSKVITYNLYDLPEKDPDME